MRDTFETRLGIVSAVIIVSLAFILEWGTGKELFHGDFRLHAFFKNVHGLSVADPVKIGGVQVGRVVKIDLASASPEVEVTLALKRGTLLHEDSKAAVKFLGVFGQNFVSIDFGTSNSPILKSNSTLQTVEQTDLNALIVRMEHAASGVEGLTRNLNMENLEHLLGPFTTFVKTNGPTLTAVFTNLEVISWGLAAGPGTIRKLLNDEGLYSASLAAVDNLNATSLELKPVVSEMRIALENANSLLATVNAGVGTLGKVVKDETLYRETAVAMSHVRDISGKINQGRGTIGNLINDQSFLKYATMSLQKVNIATEELEDTASLSLGGIAAGRFYKPFPIRR